MIFRVFDIETVPDLSVWTKNDPQYQLAANGGVREVELFPPSQANQIVAIAYLDITLNIQQSPKYSYVSHNTAAGWRPRHHETMDLEKELLSNFATGIDDNVTLVSWNGRSFDCPVMAMRALRLGLDWGWYYNSKKFRYRYSDDGHLDLMDSLADYGAARASKLTDIAHLVGLPGKMDTNGSDVFQIVNTTMDHDRVANYCLQDVVQTALIFLRTRLLFGKINRQQFLECLETFRVVAESVGISLNSIALV